MAEKKKYNSILISGRKDETLTYSRYIKDEESGESVKETLDKKVNVSDELETQQIKNGAITNEKLAADSVGNGNIQDGSVSNEKLEDGSVTNEKLAVNSITKDKLKDRTIGVEKLDNELRQTIAAATGLPDDLVETIQNVDDTLKDHQRQLDDKQSQIDDKQQQITANDDDISLLQTRSTQMEETIKGIAATGGASQATAVTYDNEKSKLTAVNIQSAVDEVVDKASIKDEEGNVVDTPFRYIQNEEFIFAKLDAEDKLLFGIQWDGTPVFGKTSAVEDRLQSQVTLLAERVATIMGDEDTTNVIDTMNELKKFFAEIENTETLTSILANLNGLNTKFGEDIKNLQDKKVDKEGGKSLIDDSIKEQFKLVENDEFIKVTHDSEGRMLEAFYKETGEPYFPINDMYHIVHNDEWLYVIIDQEDRIISGIRVDLSTYPDNSSVSDFSSRNIYANTFRSLGIPKLSKLDFDYNIIIIDGQSLSVGSETGNVVYQTDRNDNCFMLGNNVNVGNSKNVSSEVLQPLSSVSGENCITSAVLYLSSILQSNQVEKKIIAISVGQGGTTIEQLSKGSDSGFYENRFLSSLKRIKELCAIDKKTVGVSNIVWMQGESNSNDTTGDYKNKLRNLYIQMCKDIQDIFSQDSIPPMVMYGSFSGLFFCHNIPQAMVELSEEHNDMFLSNPIYQLPAYMYGHLSGNGVVWYGSYLGKSLYELNCNSEPEVLKVISAYFINMRTIKLDFCIPVKPLVFDVNMKSKLDNYGFELKKDGNPISIEVKLLGDSIYIILNENAVLDSVYSLQYVIHYDNTSKANITYGNVRDSSKCLSKYEYKDDSEEYGSSLYSGWEEIENDGSVFTPVSENVFGTLFNPGDKVSITSHNYTRYFKCISQTTFPPYSFVGGKPKNIAYGDRLPLSNWLIPFEKEIDKSLIKI